MDKKLAKELCQDKKKNLFLFPRYYIGIFCQSFVFLLKKGTVLKWAKGCDSHRIPGKSNFPDSKDIHIDENWLCAG